MFPHIFFILLSIALLFVPTPLDLLQSLSGKQRKDIEIDSIPFVVLPEPVRPLKSEVVQLLQAAKRMKQQDKIDKADRLYSQALHFAPNHPDILVEYADFLEKDKRDLVAADSLYSQVLKRDPTNKAALLRHQINLPQVKAIDNEYYKTIEAKKYALTIIPASNVAFRRAKREFYFQLIYHNNAIEGNTMTLSMTRSVLETGRAIGGQSIHEHNEIIGMDEALHFLNGTMLGAEHPLNVQTILDIHRKLLGHVEPEISGRYRTHQVYVGNFVPPKPEELPELMADLVKWLNSPEAWGLHPIEYAAIAHYRLVYIHPFVDGNGRTSRLLMNLRLIQAGYPPVIIKVQDRFKYYDALETANSGDIRPFIRFIAQCTEVSLDGYLDSLGIEKDDFINGDFDREDYLKKHGSFENEIREKDNIISLP